MQFNFHIVSQHAPYLRVLPWSSRTTASSLIARPHISNGLDINQRRRVHCWNLTLSHSSVLVSRSSCRLPTTLSRVPSPSLGFTAEKREKDWEGETEIRRPEFRRNSERRYCHASDWINARMGYASVYLSWTVYVIIMGCFCWCAAWEVFSGREEIKTLPVRPQG
jgi:hypothetical protein